jgi:glycosyltransferase involved in cell wall biosynthesis
MDPIKKVLIISFYFPPYGGTSVMRIAKLCKYLPDYGWHPIVVTVRLDKIHRIDRKLEEEVQNTCKIYHSGFVLDTPFMKFLKKHITEKHFTRFFRFALTLRIRMVFPDESMRWLPKAVLQALKAARQEDVSAIISSGDPVVNHLAAIIVSKIRKIPWIADFRDAWSVNPDRIRSRFQISVSDYVEKRILTKATIVTSVTNPVVAYLARKVAKRQDAFCCITNGYDEEETTNLADIQPARDVFLMTFTGNFTEYTQFNPFFKAIKLLVHLGKIDKRKIRIQLVGDFKGFHDDKLLEISDIIMISSHISHEEVVSMQQASHVLLLVHYGESSKYAVSAKLYEYMATGRPVLAIVSDASITAQYVKAGRVGRVVDPKRIDDIANAVLYFYNLWLEDRLVVDPDWTFIRQFERKKLAEQFASLLNEFGR